LEKHKDKSKKYKKQKTTEEEKASLPVGLRPPYNPPKDKNKRQRLKNEKLKR